MVTDSGDAWKVKFDFEENSQHYDEFQETVMISNEAKSWDNAFSPIIFF